MHYGSWEDHLPLVEFAYNNNFQTNIGMAPYEALYGRPCRSPLCWVEGGESTIVRQWTNKGTGEEIILRPEIITKTTEKIFLIRQRLLAAQSRQKKYADKRRMPLTFTVGDHVFIRVSSRKRLQSAHKLGKLAPRFV